MTWGAGPMMQHKRPGKPMFQIAGPWINLWNAQAYSKRRPSTGFFKEAL